MHYSGIPVAHGSATPSDSNCLLYARGIITCMNDDIKNTMHIIQCNHLCQGKSQQILKIIKIWGKSLFFCQWLVLLPGHFCVSFCPSSSTSSYQQGLRQASLCQTSRNPIKSLASALKRKGGGIPVVLVIACKYIK